MATEQAQDQEAQPAANVEPLAEQAAAQEQAQEREDAAGSATVSEKSDNEDGAADDQKQVHQEQEKVPMPAVQEGGPPVLPEEAPVVKQSSFVAPPKVSSSIPAQAEVICIDLD